MFGSRPPFSNNTTSFSGFGAATTNTQNTGFGSTATFGRSNTFGSTSTGTGFGATNTAAAPFGSSTTQGSSLFGATAGQATGSTGLFGSNTTSGFGPATSGFNSAATGTTGGLFGSQNNNASTGLFGSSTTNNAFGAQNKPFSFSTPTSSSTGGSIFNTGNAGSSLFNTGGAAVNGTTVKYQPVVGTDTMTRNGVTSNIQTRIEVITCMKEYEGKCLEELRVEDYLANRKGPGQGTTGGMLGAAGGFGQTANTGTGLFGSTNTAGAATAGGLFGQKPAETKPLFGASTGFGAASSSGAGGGLFGSTNTAPAFGQAPAASGASTGFSFGQNNQQQNKTGFSFFPNNNTNTSGGLFGNQAQTSTGGFGSTSTGGFSFGQNTATQQSGGLFNQPKPAFGTNTSTSGGSLFMNNANTNKPGATPAFGGFNTGTTGFGASSTASPFGTNTNTNTGGGLFGNNQNKTGFGLGTSNAFGNTGTTFNTGTSGGSLFGNTAANTGGGLFGNTATQNKPAVNFNTGTAFNTGTNTALGGFGLGSNKPTGFGTLGSGGFGTSNNTFGNTNNMFMGGGAGNTAQTAISDNNIANLIKALTDNPFGHSSLLKTPIATTGKADELLSPTNPPVSNPSSHNPPTYVLPSASLHLKPHPHPAPSSNTNLLSNRSLLFAGLDDSMTEGSATGSLASNEDIFKVKTFPSVKKLNLKVFNKLKGDANTSQDNNQSGGARLDGSPLTLPISRVASPIVIGAAVGSNDSSATATPDIIKGRENIKRLAYNKTKTATPFNDTLADLNVVGGASQRAAVDSPASVPSSAAANNNNIASPLSPANHNLTIYDNSSQDDLPVSPVTHAKAHPTGIKLTRAGYYTIPSLSELTSFIDENGKCLVENFTVGREGYGNVCFMSETDVKDLDLDSSVFIVRKEVEVYPDSSNKPPVGQGLNKAAVITLDAVWPIDKSSREVITDQNRLQAMGWAAYLEKKCLSMDAKFLEYRPDTGSWVFKVNHFSKYGLQDDNDDEMSVEDIKRAAQQQQRLTSPSNAPKTTDPSLIKSSSAAATKSLYPTLPISTVSSSTTRTADMLVGAAVSTTAANGLGGDTSPQRSYAVTSPPTTGLLPQSSSSQQLHLHSTGYNTSSDGAGSKQILSGGSSNIRASSGAAGAAAVPAELFMDSYAAEPEESASLSALGPAYPNSSTLHQLAANMFPADEDDDEEPMTATDEHYTQLSQSYAAVPRHQVAPLKKFAGKRMTLPQSFSMDHSGTSQPLVEGRLSVAPVDTTVVRPRCITPALDEGSSSSSSVTHHKASLPARAPRTTYPSLPSGPQTPSHPPVVTPSARIASQVVPLSASLMQGQHGSLSDAGLFMGPSNRVGWGPALQLVHGGEALGNEEDTATTEHGSGSSKAAGSSSKSLVPAPYLFLPHASNATSQPSRIVADVPKYSVKVERLHLTDLSGISDSNFADPDILLHTLQLCLHEILLQCPTSSVTKSSAPLMEPASGRSVLHSVAARVLQTMAQEEHTPLATIVELCLALWGRLDYNWLEEAATDSEYIEARARVETLSQWVERVSATAVHREVETAADGSGESYLEAVFSHITAREMHDACKLLQQNGDHHLALLLAQSCMGDEVPRQILAKQLANWAECGADATMSAMRLVLYTLMAGRPTHSCSNGDVIAVCKGLDWRRAFALHMWFFCPATCTISEALTAYELGAGIVSSNAEGPADASYCQVPLPQYLAAHTVPDSTTKLSYDMCYHILKLFVDPSYRLDQLLNPVTNTPDPLDVSTSWLVMIIIQSLGYKHANPLVVNRLHLSMASYLESVGLWHWSIFVLMFLKEEKARAAEVRAVLSRHVEVIDGVELEDNTFEKLAEKKRREEVEATNGEADEDDMDDEDVGFVDGEDDDRSSRMDTNASYDERDVPSAMDTMDELCGEESAYALNSYDQREKFLISKLKIPQKWINESKAILARSLGMIETEAWYLIKAGDLKRAHELLLKTIAPNAIVNEDHEYLQRYITAFEASSKSSVTVTVPDWKTGGGVYSHYLHVLTAVEEIKASQQPTQSKVEALRPRLLALCSQLNSLATPTAQHRLCVSELSRVVVGVLRAVLGEDLAATTAIANQVSQLPLTRDCALQELNTLTHQYLAGIAS